MQTAEEFENIILVAGSDGGTVRLGDVARVELGLESYGQESSYNGVPAAGFGVQLSSAANAINTAEGVHAALDGPEQCPADGVQVVYSYEDTPFVELSIGESGPHPDRGNHPGLRRAAAVPAELGARRSSR